MSGSSGETYWLLWDECDLDGWSLRTRRGLLPGFPPSCTDLPSSGTWDLTGYSPQPPLVPATSESGSSSSPDLLPTPVAQDSSTSAEAYLRRKSRDGSERTVVTSLAVVARDCLLPTPTAKDEASSSGANPAWGHGATLTDAVRGMALLPTPMARDGDGRTGGGNNAHRRMTRGDGPMLPELLDYLSSPECQMAASETTAQRSGDTRLF